MIKKIRLLMEYNTFPVWLYDRDDQIIDNDLPPEWQNDTDLECAFMALSDYYDTFFVDTDTEFRYVGFQNGEEKQKLTALSEAAIKLLHDKNNGKYIIINNIPEW